MVVLILLVINYSLSQGQEVKKMVSVSFLHDSSISDRASSTAENTFLDLRNKEVETVL